MSTSRVRVFLATSLDGFLAGEGDDLSWLPGPNPETDHGFGVFLGEIGALVMGRRTIDVALGFEGLWPYGERPIVVATHRPLTGGPPTLRPRAAPIAALIDEAKQLAGGRDVYVDGGQLVRQALDAGLVDELVVTLIPIALGRGVSLFGDSTARHRFSLLSAEASHGLVQLRLRPRVGA